MSPKSTKGSIFKAFKNSFSDDYTQKQIKGAAKLTGLTAHPGQMVGESKKKRIVEEMMGRLSGRQKEKSNEFVSERNEIIKNINKEPKPKIAKKNPNLSEKTTVKGYGALNQIKGWLGLKQKVAKKLSPSLLDQITGRNKAKISGLISEPAGINTGKIQKPAQNTKKDGINLTMNIESKGLSMDQANKANISAEPGFDIVKKNTSEPPDIYGTTE